MDSCSDQQSHQKPGLGPESPEVLKLPGIEMDPQMNIRVLLNRGRRVQKGTEKEIDMVEIFNEKKSLFIHTSFK